MQIRIAIANDIDGILRLETQIYRVDKLADNASEITKEIIESDDKIIIVAEDAAEIVGSAKMFFFPIPAHGKPFAFLEGVVVDKGRRGQGIGTKLSEEAINQARSRNCYKIIFTSGMDRSEVHEFYEKLGFKKWGYEFRMDFS